jgi:hypothetical protein
MADPAPAPLTIPNFKDLERYPARPPHHSQAYNDDLGTLVKQLERQEREHPVEVPPRLFCDRAISQAEYEKQFRERVRKLARS